MEQVQGIPYFFQNITEKNMTFDHVFQRISDFIKRDPKGNFRLIVGTDSQVHKRHTLFISAIIIQRQGKGAWLCIRKELVPRKMLHLHERISRETSLTEELAALFTDDHKNALVDLVLPHVYDGASFTLEGHIDIGSGQRNKTNVFVKEMATRIRAMGLVPVIKPDSFGASCVANKYTKRNSLTEGKKII
ncbi:ribonuclease H-like YkuK family protein [Peribacillus kribbensis]|uniref:ribonuclease H-like YkuK family protein n=1 Tax=Peribacillus kribbensis TaxID=356658 RepID=UPI00040A5157|nr:ribonuclease H-like YkuK family protein [Peribacillus kribbensis]